VEYMSLEMAKPERFYSVMYVRSTLRLLLVCEKDDDEWLTSCDSVRCYVQENSEKVYYAREGDTKWEE
jgi:hypothetical protein